MDVLTEWLLFLKDCQCESDFFLFRKLSVCASKWMTLLPSGCYGSSCFRGFFVCLFVFLFSSTLLCETCGKPLIMVNVFVSVVLSGLLVKEGRGYIHTHIYVYITCTQWLARGDCLLCTIWNGYLCTSVRFPCGFLCHYISSKHCHSYTIGSSAKWCSDT